MNQKFNSSEILRTFLKYKWVLLLSGFLSALVCLCLALFLITPKYQMTAQVLVVSAIEDPNGVSQNAKVQANLQMVNTYKALIKSPHILNRVQAKLKKGYPAEELSGMIQAQAEENSQIINILVTSSDPKVAAEVANLTAKEFVTDTKKKLKINNLELLNQASSQAEAHPIFPNPYVFSAVGFLLGLCLSIGLLLCSLFLSNKIKSEKDLELFDLPNLGTVGKIGEYTSHKSKRGR